LLQAPLYWDIYVPLGLDSARLAFTCHNFEYQGAEPAVALASCGLSVRELLRPDRMQDNSFPNKINLLKVFLLFCTLIVMGFGTLCM
jgi:glycogen synthase